MMRYLLLALLGCSSMAIGAQTRVAIFADGDALPAENATNVQDLLHDAAIESTIVTANVKALSRSAAQDILSPYDVVVLAGSRGGPVDTSRYPFFAVLMERTQAGLRLVLAGTDTRPGGIGVSLVGQQFS